MELMEKQIMGYWEYLTKMRDTAIANKNIDGQRNKMFYEGLEKGFNYALNKLDWLLKQSVERKVYNLDEE